MTASSRWLSVSLPYVLPRAPGDGDPWVEEAARQGGRGDQHLLTVSEVRAEGEVAEALGVEPGDAVVVRRRLILFDGQPVELADSYYPLSIAGGTPLAVANKIRGGAVRLLADLGYRPGQVREDVYTRAADADERAMLHLGDGEWVLCLSRQLSTRDGSPVEASMMRMVPARRLRYELSID